MKKLLLLSTILAGGFFSANAQFNHNSGSEKRTATYRDNNLRHQGPFAKKQVSIVFSDNHNRWDNDDHFRDHDRYEKRECSWQYRDCDDDRRSSKWNRRQHDENRRRDTDRW